VNQIFQVMVYKNYKRTYNKILSHSFEKKIALKTIIIYFEWLANILRINSIVSENMKNGIFYTMVNH